MIKEGIVFVLTLGLILSSALLIVGGGFGVLLYPDTYDRALNESEILQAIENSTSNVEGGDFVSIPEEDVEKITNQLLGETLSYVRGEDDELNLTVKIDEDVLREFLRENTQNMRICRPGENSFVGGEVRCRPKGVNTEKFVDEIIKKGDLGPLEGGEIDLGILLDKDKNIDKLRDLVYYYRLSLYGALLLGVICLSLIWVVNWKNKPSASRWTGAAFLIAGIFGISGVIAGGYLLDNIVLGVDFIFIGFITDLAGAVASRIGFYSILSFGAGIIFFVASIFVFRKEDNF